MEKLAVRIVHNFAGGDVEQAAGFGKFGATQICQFFIGGSFAAVGGGSAFGQTDDPRFDSGLVSL